MFFCGKQDKDTDFEKIFLNGAPRPDLLEDQQLIKYIKKENNKNKQKDNRRSLNDNDQCYQVKVDKVGCDAETGRRNENYNVPFSGESTVLGMARDE